jgi:hypothetical protein
VPPDEQCDESLDASALREMCAGSQNKFIPRRCAKAALQINNLKLAGFAEREYSPDGR